MNPVSRVLLSALALALAAASTMQYRHRDSARGRVQELLLDTGVHERLPDVAKKAEREPDPQWAKVFIARALLAEHIDPRWLEKISGVERQREIERMWERLDLARELAAETISSRPATWQAALILGGATMLDGARAGVSGLVASRSIWERSLRAAIELAPGQEEPYRLLAGGYLGIWPGLNADQQREVRGLIARAFEDETTFRLFADLWLQTANDRDDAFSLLPERSSSWQTVMSICSRRSDWSGYIAAFGRWDNALLAELEQDMAEAETRLRGGNHRGARSLMLSVVRRARLDTKYMQAISRALIQCPPGPPDTRLSKDFSTLLDWALERSVLGKSTLEPAALRRLAGLVTEPSSVQEALVSLATNDLTGAAAYERRTEGLNTEPWALYLLLKARRLAEKGDLEAAQTALAEVHSSQRGRAIELDIRRLMAGQTDAATTIMDTDHATSEWRATEWRWRGKTARLYLIPSTAARNVLVHFDVVPSGGRPVEIRWDQESRLVAVASRDKPLKLRMEITPELHLLEVESLADGRVRPGLVRLEN